MPKYGQVRDVLNGWEVSCDDDGASPDIKRETFVSR